MQFITGIMPTDYGSSAFTTTPLAMQGLLKKRDDAKKEVLDSVLKQTGSPNKAQAKKQALVRILKILLLLLLLRCRCCRCCCRCYNTAAVVL